MSTAERDRYARERLVVVLLTIVLSIVWVTVAALHPTDGRAAAWLAFVSLTVLGGYTWLRWDGYLGRLLAYGLAFGLVELIADALCVRFTGTLDYAPAHSGMVWESPWWMPLAWMVVAVQIGLLGSVLIARVGVFRGTLLASVLGAVNIPFYEEMAFHAHWWRYVDCRLWGHTPIYIIAAEAVIGGALALTTRAALRAPHVWRAGVIGAIGGVSTIAGGMIGYGLVEKIPFWLRGV